MSDTRKEFQRLQKQKYNMLRRDWNKYSDKTNQAYIQKKAKEFDVKVPKNVKAFKKYANRIANKMEERQYLYTQDNQEVIDQLNNIKKQLSDTDKYNKFSKNNKKITPLSQVYNFIKNRFGHIKGDITINDIIKAEKDYKLVKYNAQDIINKSIKEKLEMFNLDNYRAILHNIGISDKDYNKFKNEFAKADIYQVARLEPFLRNLEAREEYYLPDADYYDGDEVELLKDKFINTFTNYIIKGNRDKNNKE